LNQDGFGREENYMRQHGISNLILSLTVLAVVNAHASVYYVDDFGGKDANSGLSSLAAWQTLAKVSSVTFQPGDEILFKAGGSWTGQLDLNGNGTAASPIIVDQYGTGSQPLINGGGYQSAVLLQGVSYWEVHNLEIINDGGATLSGTTNYRAGVLVTSYGPVGNHIYLENLNIHNIFPQVGPAGYGMHVISHGSATANTYFNDVRVENCQISLTGYYGIWIQGAGAGANPGYQFNENILIRNNTFTNTGGSAAQTGWCDGVVVENNVVNGSGASVDPRQWARGSCYWPFHCNNVLVQSNQLMHARGPGDSCGAHIDYGNSNVTIQYNLSLDNEGGFVEILGGGYNLSYRYNVSINDGWRVNGVNGASQSGKLIWVSNYYGSQTIGSTNAMIYNNTIYLAPGINNFFTIEPLSVGTRIYNNIFYLAGTTTYTNSGSGTVFNNNLWQGNLPAGVPFGAGAVFANPLVANAGGTNAADYLLGPVSPAIAAGLVITNDGGQDYWGNPLSTNAPCIGANERGFSAAGVISVNLTSAAVTSQQIAAGQPYGLTGQNSLVSGWLNQNQSLTFQNLPLADGFPSSVTMTGTAPAGWNSCNLAYVGTPLLGGIVDYTGTGSPTAITLNHLSASFPNGYKVIAYVSGFNSNLGALVSAGATTFYYQTLNDPSNQFSGTLTQTLTTNDLGAGNAPFAQYAVFGDPVALTNDTLTLAVHALYGGGAILGGFQILSTGSLTSHGVPDGWFQGYGLPVDDLTDTDADGQLAWQEYYAGTNPTNAASVFRVIDVQQTGSNLTLTWLGGTNGYPGNYSLCVSSNLTDWTVLESNTIPRNPSGTNTWVLTNAVPAADHLFYRPCVEYAP
jgi:hypothetical protein